MGKNRGETIFSNNPDKPIMPQDVKKHHANLEKKKLLAGRKPKKFVIPPDQMESIEVDHKDMVKHGKELPSGTQSEVDHIEIKRHQSRT